MSKPLRILIVDDEPLAIERMLILLSRCDDVAVVATATCGQAALELTETLTPDACLLDIGMPEMDGIELARALGELPTPPWIVFITAFDRFAVAAFDTEAVDYLVKPVDPQRLNRALQRVRHHAATAGENNRARKYLGEFWVPDQLGLTRLPADLVDRITAERDYMRLHAGRRSWLINDSLARLEAQLDPETFVRLHRGAIVRQDFIVGLRHADDGWFARLGDGSEQKVGRLYAEKARQLPGRARPSR